MPAPLVQDPPGWKGRGGSGLWGARKSLSASIWSWPTQALPILLPVAVLGIMIVTSWQELDDAGGETGESTTA